MTSETEERRRHKVEVQAMIIEEALARLGLPAGVRGGAAGPRSTTFLVEALQGTVEQSLMAIERQVQAALGATRVHIDWDCGRLRVEVEEVPAPHVNLLDLLGRLPDLPPGVIPLGQADDGRPVFLNLLVPFASHVLVLGGAAAGKSSLLRSAALSLSMSHGQSEIQMAFIDPSGGHQPMRYLPHALCGVAREVGEVEDLLQFLDQEMVYRTRQGIRRPAIITVIDDLPRLLDHGGVAVENLIARLLRRGLQASLHLIVSARDVPSRELSHAFRAHAPARIVGRVANSGVAESNAKFLLGRGDFIAVNGTTSVRFQAAYADDFDLHLCLKTLHRRRRPALLARPFDVRPRLVPTGAMVGDNVQFTFDGERLSLWE